MKRIEHSEVIDVVTICRNPGASLYPTIESVLREPAVGRYIIIDGGSTDETSSIVRHYGSRISEFVSEPDTGISEAMNKGLARCSANHVIFLHAGDVFLGNGALAFIAGLLKKSPVDIVSCPVLVNKGAKVYALKSRGFNFWMRLKTGIPHQGAVCSRELFKRIGMFDTSLKVAMDYDFFLRAYLAGATIHYHSVPLSRMAPDGLSWRLDWPSLKVRLQEEQLIHARYADSATLRSFYAVYHATYPVYKYLRTWPHTWA